MNATNIANCLKMEFFKETVEHFIQKDANGMVKRCNINYQFN